MAINTGHQDGETLGNATPRPIRNRSVRILRAIAAQVCEDSDGLPIGKPSLHPVRRVQWGQARPNRRTNNGKQA